MSEDPPRWSLTMIVAPIVNSPGLGVTLALFFAIGIGMGLIMLPQEWSVPWRIVAGTALGFAANMSFFVNRMIAVDFE